MDKNIRRFYAFILNRRKVFAYYVFIKQKKRNVIFSYNLKMTARQISHKAFKRKSADGVILRRCGFYIISLKRFIKKYFFINNDFVSLPVFL